jgi:hypothetical protein
MGLRETTMAFSVTPKRVYEKLVAMGLHRGYMIGCPDGRAIEQYIGKDERLPEHLRPGYLLTRLTPEEREALKGLTSDMARNYRY